MKRRDFLTGTALLLGATLTPRVLAADEEAALKRFVEDYYRTCYVDQDKKKYRSLLTDDYVLLENGELLSGEQDIALIPSAADEYQRKDTFDFKSVQVLDAVAYLVYFLKSDIKDKKNGTRHREYLESIILRRDKVGTWRVALLHSTRLTKP